MKDIIIAIDGHSGCGKSTTSRLLAKNLNFKYLDSGAMYRAVTLYFINKRVSQNDTKKIKDELNNIIIDFKYVEDNQHIFLNDQDVENEIRSDEISNQVSLFSSNSSIRKFLVNKQKTFGINKNIVVEGRDITTVVFPDAEIKVFMTADIQVRAKRRFNEMKSKNPDITYSDVIKNLEDRDIQDSTRKDSPLMVADDAFILDTSDLEINDQVDKIINFISNKFS
ncbi:MAG: cytidylate kinase [Flammeovirgaceae bacterium]|nr:cytidylate kinase [Flammeovirgaceae bacterium]